MKRFHAVVTGRVQGVGFRYFTRNAAVALDLKGYVKNRPDGAVEVVAEGSEDSIEEFRMQLWKGPSFANVVDVDEQFSDGRGEFDKFLIMR